jgi:hypothetical protein
MGPIRIVSLVFSALAMLAGGAGMLMSFFYLASREMEDITAGTSGFVAGAILIGAGVVLLAIISTKERVDSREKESLR